jgi:hypothetical protein
VSNFNFADGAKGIGTTLTIGGSFLSGLPAWLAASFGERKTAAPTVSAAAAISNMTKLSFKP